MWERESALRSVDRLIDRVRSGCGGALFLHGEPGVGKSTMLSEAVRLADSAAVDIARAQGSPVETGLPFSLFAQVLGDFGGTDIIAAQPNTVSAGEAFYRLWTWLQQRSGPLVLLFDDLHWADPDSVNVLSVLCRRLAPLAVGVIATSRPWPREAFQIAVELQHGGFAEQQSLPPLSAKATAAMLTHDLGHPPAQETMDLAYTTTAGNPLLLRYVSAMLADGADLAALGAASSTPASNQLLLHRFAGFSDEEMRCARAGSVLGVRFRPGLAIDLAQVPHNRGDTILDGLCRAQVLREAPRHHLEFTHPLLRQLLYDDLPAPTRLRLHARAFTLLDEQHLQAEAAEHAARGELVGHRRAVAVLTETGRAAFTAGAVKTAVRYLGIAREFAGDAVDTKLIQLSGQALMADGRVHDAIEVLLRADRVADTDAARAETARLLGRAYSHLCAPDDAELQFERAVTLGSATSPRTSIEALLDQATSRHLRNGANSLPLTEQALQLADRVDAALRRRARSAWGYIACLSGEPSGFAAVAEAAREAAADPDLQLADLSWTWGALSSYAYSAKWMEQFVDSERYFALALGAADKLGAVGTTAMLLAARSELFIRTGRLHEALADLTRALDLSEFVPLWRRYTLLGWMWILLLQGELDASERLCAEVEAEVGPVEDIGAALWLWYVRGRRALRDGDITAACDAFQTVERVTRRGGIGEPCLCPWARDAVEAYASAGRTADVERVVSWLDSAAERLGCVWPRIAAATGRALLSSDDAGAAHWFQRALTLHDTLDMPLERVETLLTYGGWLRRKRHTTHARRLLADAVETAERSGANWLAQRASHELALTGGRRRRGSSTALTAAEQRVADLAATGRGNAQIAHALSVTVSTVETHLQRVYTKLNLHSRRELMALRHNDQQQTTDG